MALRLAFQRMKPEPRQIKTFRPGASVKDSQNVQKLLNMLRRHPPRRSTIVERLEPSMPERRDHTQTLICRLSLVN